jgi:predicted MFS family arabinose efflux permease
LAFGASYFPVAALLLVWSGGVFHERPTAGFSVVLFFLALGSIVGPAAFGAVAEPFGLRAAFWCAAALTALSIALRPSGPATAAPKGERAGSPAVRGPNR